MFPAALTSDSCRCCSPVSGSEPGSSISLVIPITELMGVRSSWLTFDQKRVFDSLASRNCRLFSSSSAYSARTPRLVLSNSSVSSL